MIYKYIFLTIAIFSALLRADILYTENFDEDGVWPDGWTHDEYIDPVSYTHLTLPTILLV